MLSDAVRTFYSSVLGVTRLHHDMSVTGIQLCLPCGHRHNRNVMQLPSWFILKLLTLHNRHSASGARTSHTNNIETTAGQGSESVPFSYLSHKLSDTVS
jgi:hypothetical protein